MKLSWRSQHLAPETLLSEISVFASEKKRVTFMESTIDLTGCTGIKILMVDSRSALCKTLPFQTNPFLAANGSSPSPLTIISRIAAEASAGPLPVIYSRNAYARSIPVATSGLQCHFDQTSLPAVTPELDQIFLSSVATHRALAIQVMGRSLVSSYKTRWIRGIQASRRTLTSDLDHFEHFFVRRGAFPIQ